MEENKNLDTNNNPNNSPEEPRWYILKTKPGKEKMVVDALVKKMQNPVIGKNLLGVKIINEEIQTIKKDRKTKKEIREYVEKNTFPNHIYIKMIYSKEIWWEIVSTEGAYSFLGPNGWPQALRSSEIDKIGLEKQVLDISEIQVGDKIKITGGQFVDIETVVESKDEENNTVKVCIYLLNQPQQFDIDINHVKKIK